VTEPTTRTPNRVVRAGWFAGGWVAVAVGGVGIVVPGLPTTVFFIIAAYCFGKSSPRFEQWVLDLPKVGPLVRDHRAGLGMTRTVKRTAITTMWIAIAVSAFVLYDRRWYAAVTAVVLGFIGTWYILARVPTKVDQPVQ
jgi:uncharacterized membrane protein YbaN (DUF454 family)